MTNSVIQVYFHVLRQTHICPQIGMMAYPVIRNLYLRSASAQARQGHNPSPISPSSFSLMSFNDLERGYGPSNSGRQNRPRTGPIAIGTLSHPECVTCVQRRNINTHCFNLLEEHDDLNYKQITQRISQQIFHINGNITSIDRLIDFLGGPRDSVEIRNKL